MIAVTNYVWLGKSSSEEEDENAKKKGFVMVTVIVTETLSYVTVT
jgi:hypothetical protein